MMLVEKKHHIFSLSSSFVVISYCFYLFIRFQSFSRCVNVRLCEDVPVVTYETSTLKILGSRSLTLFRNRLRIYMNIDTIVIVSNDVQIMFLF